METTNTETAPTNLNSNRAAAMKIIRGRFPQLRRSGSTAIIKSGSSQAIYGCLCGSTHSTSTSYNGRNALHVHEWEHAHADCALHLINATHIENRLVCHGRGQAVNPTLVVL
jgi:hypothetical protein